MPNIGSAVMKESTTGAEMADIEDNRDLANQVLLDPKATPEKLKRFSFGVGVPCPTRTMTRETALAIRGMAYPMFGNPIHYSPDSLEVGEARNRIVEMAMRDGVEWIFFIDYDVAPPPNALIKLLSLKVPIAAGVYHLKQVPSYPLIQVEGWDYAFEDYDVGDLIKADGVGMGCTLIKTKVFEKIDPPWFKTVPGYSPNTHTVLPNMTEDIYFCQKARKAGYDIIVDTSVQCSHVDWRTGVQYHYVPDPNGGKRGTPGWSYRSGEQYITETVADAGHPGHKWAETGAPVAASTDKIDLGSGPCPPEGFTGIDLFEEGDRTIKGDVSDLGWFRKEHGLARSIRASHVLEHMSHHDIPRIAKDWVATLRPGGDIEIRVPDGEKALRDILDRVDSGEDQDPQADWLNAVVYGYQVGEGHEHKSLFTENRLNCLGASVGLVDVEVVRVDHAGNGKTVPDTSELVLTGTRPNDRRGHEATTGA